jgi:5-formyltetrahydrofolate cyclo-ligase
VATDDEVATLPLIETARAEEKKVVLPSMASGTITWREITNVSSRGELVPGMFDIPEPAETCPVWDPREESGTVVWLIPGVGFDRAGRRLGRGGGHYDRALAAAEAVHGTLGLAFTCQLVEEIPAGPEDWQLEWIITPGECIRTRGTNT